MLKTAKRGGTSRRCFRGFCQPKCSYRSNMQRSVNLQTGQALIEEWLMATTKNITEVIESTISRLDAVKLKKPVGTNVVKKPC